MGDSTIKKIQSSTSPTVGAEKFLVSGKSVALRMWEGEEPGEKEASCREYETVGYVLKGRAEVEAEGQRVILEEGDSWLIPAGSTHFYNILEKFTAIEATSPPARLHKD